MSIESVLSWVFTGLIVGLIACALVQGRQRMGFLGTTIVGIAGAMVGGFLYTLIRGPAARPFELSAETWYGWTVSVLGATLLVWIGNKMMRAR